MVQSEGSAPYMVELLYEVLPSIDSDRLHAELQKRCGRVEELKSNGRSHHYAFPDFQVSYREGEVPAQVLLVYPDSGHPLSNLDDALQQSWDWPAAGDAVANCRVSLLLTDMMAGGLDPRQRLSLFHDTLEAMLLLAPCRAIHWVRSQQLVDPVAYLVARQSPTFHPLQSALNLRFFRISNGQPDEAVMDTMGLAGLGLPDVQCHFTGLDPDAVARVLFNSAYYLFDQGDVIEDGHTIQGIQPEDRWRCQHEIALAAPKREVLDLNPGVPYAAAR